MMKNKLITALAILLGLALMISLWMGRNALENYEGLKNDHIEAVEHYEDSVYKLNCKLKISENKLRNRNIEIGLKKAEIRTLKRYYAKKISDVDHISPDSSRSYITNRYRLEKTP